jgi:hypothetical protein
MIPELVTSAFVSFRRTGRKGSGKKRKTALLHPLSLSPLLLHHLAQAASFGLAAQLTLGDKPSLLAVGAEDFVLGYQPTKPLEQLFLALTRPKRDSRQP